MTVPKLTARGAVLFVSGLDLGSLGSSRRSGADLVCVDLEDAVPPNRKDCARAELSAALRAEEILTSAHTSAREIKKSANEYVEDILADLESYVSRSLDIIRQNRESMRGR